MSKEIDEKVVQMRFENSDFDKKVKKTLEAVEQLDKGLTFEGAVVGISNLTSSIAKITLVQRYTNKAISVVERFMKSLSVDQLSSGWAKYEEKTASVQTIMAATGKSIEEVNEQLSKLNWFTDETSYSLTDMTNNIGKFTSQGVELSKAVTAMEGISTWASLSGQGVNEASRAMYNLSQALGVGSVKLMDWKSIENANMATKEFKEQALEAAAAEGSLTKEIDKNGKVTYKTLKGTKVTTANFSTTLSEAWFTSDALLTVLEKYGSYADGLNELYETMADGMEKSTSEIINDLKELQNADDDTILDSGYTKEQLATFRRLSSELDSIGAKAFAAAQEAKTFTEAINSVKDAVSTGWMNTYEIIFGNYTEAKVLWTDLANELWDIFAGGAEARNKLLESALKDNKDIADTISEFIGMAPEAVRYLRDAGIENGFLNEDFQELITKVTGGDEALGGFLTTVLSSTSSVEELNRFLENNLGIQTEQMDKLVDIRREYGENSKEYRKYLNEISAGNAKIKQYLDIFAKVRDSLDRLSGRDLLIQSFTNLLHALVNVMDTVKEAFHDIFPKATAQNIYGAIYAFSKLTKKISESSEELEPLKNLLKGIFAIFDTALYVVKEVIRGFKMIISPLTGITGSAGKTAGAIGELLVKFRDIVKSGTVVRTTVNAIAMVLRGVVIVIRNLLTGLFTVFKKYVFVPETLEKIKNVLSTIGAVLLNFVKMVWPVLEVALGAVVGLVYGIIIGVQKLISVLKPVFATIGEKMSEFFGRFKEFSPGVQLLGTVSNTTSKGLNILSNAIARVAEVCSIAIGAVTLLAQKLKEKFASARFFEIMSGVFEKIYKILKDVADFVLPKIKEFVGQIVAELKKTWNEQGVIGFLKWFETAALGVFAFRISRMVKVFTDSIESLGDMFDGVRHKLNASAFRDFTAAVLELVAAIVIVSLIPEDNLYKGVEVLTLLMVALGALVYVAGRVTSGKGAAAVVAMGKMVKAVGTIMIVLAHVLRAITKIESTKIDFALRVLMMLSMLSIGMMFFMQKIAETSDGKTLKTSYKPLLSMVVVMGAMVSILKKIIAIDENDVWRATGVLTALAGLTLGLSVLNKLISKIDGGSGKNKALPSTLITLIALTGIVKVISTIDENDVWRSTAILGILSGLILSISVLNKLVSKIETGDRRGTALVTSTLILLALTGIVKIVSNIPEEDVWRSVAIVSIMSGLVLTIAAINKLISKIDGGKGSVAVLIVATAMIATLAYMVKMVAAIPEEDAWRSVRILGVMTAVLGGLMIVLGIVAKMTNTGSLVASTAALAVITGSIATLSLMILEIAKLPKGVAGRAVGTLAAIAGILTFMMTIISIVGLIAAVVPGGAAAILAIALSLQVAAMAFVTVAIGTAAAFMIVSKSLSNLAEGLKAFNELSISEALGAVVKLVPVLIALGVGLTSMVAAIPGALALVIVSGSLVALAVGIQAIADVSSTNGVFGKLVSSLVGLGIGLTAMAQAIPGAIALRIAATSLTDLANGIASFGNLTNPGEVVWSIAGSLAKLALGFAAMSVSLVGIGATAAAAASLTMLGKALDSINDNNTEKMLSFVKTCILLGVALKVLHALLPGPASILALSSSILALSGSLVVLSKVIPHVLDALEPLFSKFKQAGSYVAAGLQNGLESGKKKVVDSVKGLGGKMIDTFKKKLDIHSPSKIFEKLGKFVTGGASKGVDEGSGSVIDKIKSLASNMISSFKDGLHEGEPDVEDTIEDISENGLEAFFKAWGSEYGSLDGASWKTELLGLNVMEGLEEGLVSGSKDVDETLESISNSLLNSLSNLLNPLGSDLNSYISDLFASSTTGSSSSRTSNDIFNKFEENKNTILGQVTDIFEEYNDELEERAKLIANPFKKLSFVTEDYVSEWIKWGKSNLKGLADWTSNLNTLKKSKLNKDLVKWVEEQGINNAGMVAELVQATDAQIDELNRIWIENAKYKEESNKVTGEKLLENMRDQKKAYENWLIQIKNLESKGASSDVIEYIKNQGYKNRADLEALLELDSKSIEEVNALYSKVVAPALTGDDLLNNMQSQVNGITAWKNKIEEVSKVASEDVVKYFESLGAKNSSALDAFYASMGDENWVSKFNELWEKNNELNNASSLDSTVGQTADEFLANMQANIDKAVNWKDALASAQARGISNEFMTYLKNLGPEAAETVKMVAEMTQEQIDEAEAGFKAKNKLSAEDLLMDYADKEILAEEYAKLWESVLDKGLDQSLIKGIAEKEVDEAVKYLRAIDSMNKDAFDTLNANAVAANELIDSTQAAMKNAALKAGENAKAKSERAMMALAEVEMAAAKAELAAGLMERAAALDSASVATNVSQAIENSKNKLDMDSQTMCEITDSSSDEMGQTFNNNFSGGFQAGENAALNIVRDTFDESERICREEAETNGEYIGEGLAEGMSYKAKRIRIAARQLEKAAEEEARLAFRINSPSKVFFQLGEYVAEGLANGISDNAILASNASKDMADEVLEETSNIIKNIYHALDSDLDLVPKITPVLDLSEVKKNATKLSTMLSTNNAISAGNTLNRTNTRAEIQNGNNSTPVTSPTYNFTQNNYSPKALSRIDIYRQTNNQFTAMQRVVAT